MYPNIYSLVLVMVVACFVGRSMAFAQAKQAQDCLFQSKLAKCREYLKKYPNGALRADIQGEIDAATCVSSPSEACAIKYLVENPNGHHVARMRSVLRTQRTGSVQGAITAFLTSADPSQKTGGFERLLKHAEDPAGFDCTAFKGITEKLKEHWQLHPTEIPMMGRDEVFFKYFAGLTYIPTQVIGKNDFVEACSDALVTMHSLASLYVPEESFEHVYLVQSIGRRAALLHTGKPDDQFGNLNANEIYRASIERYLRNLNSAGGISRNNQRAAVIVAGAATPSVSTALLIKSTPRLFLQVLPKANDGVQGFILEQMRDGWAKMVQYSIGDKKVIEGLQQHPKPDIAAMAHAVADKMLLADESPRKQ